MEIDVCMMVFFFGKYAGRKVVSKLTNPSKYDLETGMTFANNGSLIEAEICNYITAKESRIKMPKVLDILTLDSDKLKEIISKHDDKVFNYRNFI